MTEKGGSPKGDIGMRPVHALWMLATAAVFFARIPVFQSSFVSSLSLWLPEGATEP